MSIQKKQLFNRRIGGISDSLYLMFIAILTIGGTIYIYQDMSSLTNSSEANSETTTAHKASKASNVESNNVVEAKKNLTEIKTQNEAATTAAATASTEAKPEATNTITTAAPESKQTETKSIIESVSETVSQMATTVAEVAPISIETNTAQPSTQGNNSKATSAVATTEAKPSETSEPVSPSATNNTDANQTENNNAPLTVFAPAQQMADMMPQDMQQNMQQNYDHMRNQMPNPVRQQMPEQVQQDHMPMNMPYPARPPMHNQYSQDQAYGMPYNMNDMQQQYQDNMNEQYNHMQQQIQNQGYPQAPNFDRPQIHYQNNAPYGGQFPPQGMPQPWNGQYNN